MTDLNRDQRLDYERRILAAEVETVRLAQRAKRFVAMIERNTEDLDAALCVANQALDRRGHDRLVVEPWMPALLSLKDDIAQILPDGDDYTASADRSPEGGDRETGRHAKHGSAVGNAETPNPDLGESNLKGDRG